MEWRCYFFQAEDGIRDVERSRGLGDVYKRQQINTVSIEIQVSQVEPVKPAKCSESSNPAHVKHGGGIDFGRGLMAIS